MCGGACILTFQKSTYLNICFGGHFQIDDDSSVDSKMFKSWLAHASRPNNKSNDALPRPTSAVILYLLFGELTPRSPTRERSNVLLPTFCCTPTTLLPKPWTTIYHPSVQFLSVVRGTMHRKTVDRLQRPVKNPEKNHASPCNEPFKTPLKQPRTFSNHLL